MNWQTIVQQNNLAIAEIPFKKLANINRLDAEYFDPLYLEQENKLNIKKPVSISNYVEISDGNHLSITEHFVDDGGVPYFRGQDVNNIFLNSASPMRIPIEIYSKGWMKRSHFKANDILLSIVGTIGGLSFVPDDMGDASGSCKIAILRPKEKIFSKIVMVFLLSKYGQFQLKRMTRGAVQMGIILEDIPKILVPTFSEKITSVIDGLIANVFEIEKKSREQFLLAEQLLLADLNLADYISSDTNTSTRKLSDCLANDRFDAEYWQPKYDDIAQAIKSYRNGFDTFDNLFVMGNQTTIKPDEEYSYVELADVNSSLGTIENYTEMQGKELPSRGRMPLRQNDVIMSSLDGSLNKTALVTIDKQNIIGSTGFFVLRKKYFEPEVALVLLKSGPVQEIVGRQAQGTILTAIPKSSLSRILLPKIATDTQAKIKKLVVGAHKNKAIAQLTLEKAKRAVEIFVEQDEAQALAYLAS